MGEYAIFDILKSLLMGAESFMYNRKLGDRKIDFIATRTGERRYIQVAYLLATQQVIEREFGVLRDIPDNYPKCVISMDTAFGGDLDGIQRLNLIDFLLEESNY